MFYLISSIIFDLRDIIKSAWAWLKKQFSKKSIVEPLACCSCISPLCKCHAEPHNHLVGYHGHKEKKEGIL